MINIDKRNVDSKSLTLQRYSKLAQRYVESSTHAEGEDLEMLFDKAKVQPNWVVLDVATGGGHTALRFAPNVKHITVSDFSEPMLIAAETHLRSHGITNADYQYADAEELPFPDESYDLVTCRLAIHHFPQPHRFISEAHRVLKKQGVLLIQDHCAPEDSKAACFIDAFEALRDPSHYRTLPVSEWLQQFSDAGITIMTNDILMKRHNLFSWARRQDCSDEVIQRLELLLSSGPEAAVQWLQPLSLGSKDVSFANPNIIVKGVKL